ncbi:MULTISPECIES: YicC/YloC family endoribonuclease [Myxococcus]|uniref:YicC family protein n=1 Tax=Myxococcus llanfairpwllgwyngyllgogerychwyrndrobwllllantysiliogogogochensis TaxID=2590453 RepID=A0A540WMU9_9BACT|nr:MULTISPECIES: YicC/YloC family endoribonuclease [Myxococcus]NTX08412.1 YicC family protein [Myxococcus sp. CA040A]NTX16686.1 YicC family protein [Myxococcus sp. CA056]TQF09754.1 YicC family protein [Myxococcus llanfairpwllgwyngyllgogerychwyrndrobwllllantysiliogogogochensis]
MLKSMTGFGAGRARVGDEEVSVELRSLNHKFCEVKARLPRELTSLEPSVTKQVKDRLARGSVELLVKRQSSTTTGTVPTVDLNLAREYLRTFRELAKELGLPADVAWSQVANQQGVVRLEEKGVNLESATPAVTEALEQALGALEKMRLVEGEAIYADLDARLKLIEGWSREVAHLAPRAVHDYQQRLTERVAELARGVAVDPQRLAQEVALFAERTDIAEEVTRLASHLEQFRALMASTEPAGRRMDFLVQEMHREVNTTGSKSQHTEISARVVSMKAEVERIREQVQNVE